MDREERLRTRRELYKLRRPETQLEISMTQMTVPTKYGR